MITNRLIRAIERSEYAFTLYSKDRLYYQALRILKANLKIYSLLQVFLYSCDQELVKDVYDYLFHLEDWFEQFKDLEKMNPTLEGLFVFQRLSASLPFPQNFKSLISKPI